MLDKSTKDATLMLRKWFHEASRSKKQPILDKAQLSAMNSAELASLKTALSSKLDMTIRHLYLLQVARAMEEVRSQDKRSKWEVVSSAEKILRLSVIDGSQSIALQLSDMVQQILNNGMLDLSNVHTLAIVGYALAGEASPKGFSNGPFSWKEEAVLKDSLLNAILKGPADFSFPRRLKRALETRWERSKREVARGKAKDAEKDMEVNDDWGEWEGVEEESEDGDYVEAHLKLEIRDWLQELMTRLHCISQARARLPISLRCIEEQIFTMGLLQQIFPLIFSKCGVPRLHHHISSVGRIFRSGLGRFGLGQSKSKLGDCKLIIVSVIGGISDSEIQDIKEAQVGLQGAEGVEVLIGGTTVGIIHLFLSTQASNALVQYDIEGCNINNLYSICNPNTQISLSIL